MLADGRGKPADGRPKVEQRIGAANERKLASRWADTAKKVWSPAKSCQQGVIAYPGYQVPGSDQRNVLTNRQIDSKNWHFSPLKRPFQPRIGSSAHQLKAAPADPGLGRYGDAGPRSVSRRRGLLHNRWPWTTLAVSRQWMRRGASDGASPLHRNLEPPRGGGPL